MYIFGPFYAGPFNAGPYNAKGSKIMPIRAGVKRADKVLLIFIKTILNKKSDPRSLRVKNNERTRNI